MWQYFCELIPHTPHLPPQKTIHFPLPWLENPPALGYGTQLSLHDNGGV